MELRRPVNTGTTSQAGDDLLHSAAMRVQERLDAEDRRNRAIARAKTIHSLCSWLVVLVLLAGGFLAWRKGLIDKILGKSEPTPANTTEVAGTEAKAGESTGTETAPAKAAEQPGTAGKPATVVKKEAEKQPVKPKVDLLAAAKAKFNGAKVDHWKNAIDEDRPGKARELTFTGLVPDGKGSYTMLELQLGGNLKGVKAAIITPNGETVPLEAKEYGMLIEKQPQLVVREGRAYFCSARKTEKKVDFGKAPTAGVEFNPSKEEFGTLYDFMRELKLDTSKLVYEVGLKSKSLGQTLPVKKVGFGEALTSIDFTKAVAPIPGDAVVREAVLDTAKVVVK